MTIEQLFPERWKINNLPYSKCRNCKGELRLYEGKWYHIEMTGGEWFLPSKCKRAYPLRCEKCGARIDYRITNATYHHFKCQDCIAECHNDDKIGNITNELRKQLEQGNHPHLKYGTSVCVVLTRTGIFFEDIC